MFTLSQINEAHSKVRSGVDFPQYVQELIELGVESYEVYVDDGRTVYLGADGFTLESEAQHPFIEVAEQSNRENFAQQLRVHQRGESDYMTFCYMAAENGVYKRRVNMDQMTCIYYDVSEDEVLMESIPGY